MHRLPVALTVPQPCSESWAAMSPTAAGRHCGACQKTVVDFTLKSDAEILAYLTRAAGGRTCGRFAAGQLERPLQRAAPAVPTAARWRTWLAAAVAVWAARETVSAPASAQAATEWRARYSGGPVPATPPIEVVATPVPAAPPVGVRRIILGMPARVNVPPGHLTPVAAAPLVLRGVIVDFSNNEAVPGVTVLIQGTGLGTSTGPDGTFALSIPAGLAGSQGLRVTVSSIGYFSQVRVLPVDGASAVQNFRIQPDVRTLSGEVVICTQPRALPPAPWHPRQFYNWGKYWLTRPFRRG